MWKLDVESTDVETYESSRHDRSSPAKQQWQTKLMLGIIIMLLLITVSMQLSQFTSSVSHQSRHPHGPPPHEALLIAESGEIGSVETDAPRVPTPTDHPQSQSIHSHTRLHAVSPELNSETHSLVPEASGPSLADGCFHVYVDVGSSTGIQIRKLFEARLFPGGAPYAMAKFDQYFGPWPARVSQVCAFAFEPNPHHAERLQKLAASYHDIIDARMKAYTRTAAGVINGVATFITDGDTWNDEWGATISDLKDTPSNKDHANKSNGTSASNTVQLIDLAEWMTQNVIKRRLPDFQSDQSKHHTKDRRKPAVVMKIDIEGRDSELISHLMRTGVLCHVDYLYVEHVDEDMTKALTKAMQFQGCPTVIEFMDDEQCHRCKYPLVSDRKYPDILEKVRKAKKLDELGWPVDD